MILSRSLIALCLALPALAAAHEQHAHEHGVGRLDIAVEGRTVDIVLAGPGHNFVGFEHAAETPAEREALALARAKLLDAAALFGGLAACKASVDVDAPDGDDRDHDHDHGHGHGQGRDAHAHGAAGDKAAHGHEHHDDHDHHAGHTDWEATYRFVCPDAVPSTLTLGIFAAFAQTTELRWQAVTSSGQTGGVATPAQATLRLP